MTDNTLKSTLSDLVDLAEDLAPGPNQGEWAKKVFADAPPAERPRVVGMPNKVDRKKAKS